MQEESAHPNFLDRLAISLAAACQTAHRLNSWLAAAALTAALAAATLAAAGTLCASVFRRHLPGRTELVIGVPHPAGIPGRRAPLRLP
eukprot:CAMPEP_0174722278 /NCGR_PEP_ID=MMETSP1094-20130205/38067_1 /TAXON_ID=156173 /ORGANISM="Chrysochromulina brevifilum, Strain UTEX LB 985" /LENGTH=87 /DNA_ID=CAMNT_0015923107 /DNA_START=107 /DNA_END=367 /DNA_ORIENTATION=+